MRLHNNCQTEYCKRRRNGSSYCCTTEKYRKYDRENQTPAKIPKSLEQRIFELEVKVKLLEKKKAQFKRQNYVADSKAVNFDIMRSTEKENNIEVRRTSPLANSSASSQKAYLLLVNCSAREATLLQKSETYKKSKKRTNKTII